MQGREDLLTHKPLKNRWNARRQVIVKQHKAGLEVFQSKPVSLANQGFENKLEWLAEACLALERRGLSYFWVQAADTNLKPSLLKEVP